MLAVAGRPVAAGRVVASWVAAGRVAEGRTQPVEGMAGAVLDTAADRSVGKVAAVGHKMMAESVRRMVQAVVDRMQKLRCSMVAEQALAVVDSCTAVL